MVRSDAREREGGRSARIGAFSRSARRGASSRPRERARRGRGRRRGDARRTPRWGAARLPRAPRPATAVGRALAVERDDGGDDDDASGRAMVTSGRSREDDRARGGRADGDVARCGRERRGKRCGGHRARAGCGGFSARTVAARVLSVRDESRAVGLDSDSSRLDLPTTTSYGNVFLAIHFMILHMISGQEGIRGVI